MANEMDFYQIAGLLGASVAWLHQIRTKSRRETIKTDLEILDKARVLFGSDSKQVALVEKVLTHGMGIVYGDPSETGAKAVPWADLILAVFCAIGVYGFAPSNISELTWQLALSGVFAFIGIGALINARDNWPGKRRG